MESVCKWGASVREPAKENLGLKNVGSSLVGGCQAEAHSGSAFPLGQALGGSAADSFLLGFSRQETH
jgi:hypothetical protein